MNNNLLLGSALFTVALIIGGIAIPDRTDAAAYDHTLQVRAEPDAVQAPPPGFEGTPPAEIPADTHAQAEDGMIVDLPVPARAETKHVFQIPARFIGRQKPGQSRASDLIGAPVLGEDGELIAKISDLLVDENYHVTAIVLSTGGVLGIGDHKVALPRYSLDIKVVQNGLRASVPLSKADLQEAPEFQPLQPDGGLLSDGGWLQRKLDPEGAEPAIDG